jgi:hypothetical protein
MARFARIIPPGSLVHVIVRFVDGEYRISCDHERDEYIRRLGTAVEQTDWRVLSTCPMSSHAHWSAIAGLCDFETIGKPLHAGFASWLNRRQRRRGPVIAERPTTVVMRPEDAARLIAYQHNNPVRAGLVATAAQSHWSSHRAYLGCDPRPSWLDIELGLQLCGFSTDEAGRKAFDRYVAERATEPRDPLLYGGNMRVARRALRRELGTAIEASYPVARTEEGTLAYHAIAASAARLRPRWHGHPAQIVELVAQHRHTCPEVIRSTSRVREITVARRLVIVVGRELGLRLCEIARYVGISAEAAGQLERRADAQTLREAAAICRRLKTANDRETTSKESRKT